MIGWLLVSWARLFAIFAHSSIDHRRRWTGEPYWHHLERVATYVRMYNGTNYQIAAAWLHDTVEDTWVRQWMIRLLFGRRVAELVKGLTNTTVLADGNRFHRMRMDRIRLGETNSDTQTIKICDRIDNCISMFCYAKKFARTYWHETMDLVHELSLADPDARKALLRLLEESKTRVFTREL